MTRHTLHYSKIVIVFLYFIRFTKQSNPTLLKNENNVLCRQNVSSTSSANLFIIGSTFNCYQHGRKNLLKCKRFFSFYPEYLYSKLRKLSMCKITFRNFPEVQLRPMMRSWCNTPSNVKSIQKNYYYIYMKRTLLRI